MPTKKSKAIAQQIITVTVIFFLSHWVGLLPLVLRGMWINYIIPINSEFAITTLHLIAMSLAYLVFQKHKSLWIIPLVYLIVALTINFQAISVMQEESGGKVGGLYVDISFVLIYMILSSSALIFGFKNFNKLSAKLFSSEVSK